jgi:protein TonB
VLKRLKEIQMQFCPAPGPAQLKLLKRQSDLQHGRYRVKPEFPGGMAKFYKYVGDNYRALKKKVLEEKFT